jgi:hypothetical protein
VTDESTAVTSVPAPAVKRAPPAYTAEEVEIVTRSRVTELPPTTLMPPPEWAAELEMEVRVRAAAAPDERWMAPPKVAARQEEREVPWREAEEPLP